MHLEERKNIHPFFAKPARNPSPAQDTPLAEPQPDPPNNDLDFEPSDTSAQAAGGRKKRARPKSTDMKAKKAKGPIPKSQAPLDKFAFRTNGPDVIEDVTSATIGVPPIPGQPDLEEDPNNDRRKRQKTVSPAPSPGELHGPDLPTHPGDLDWHLQLKIEAGKATPEQRETFIVSAGQDPGHEGPGNADVDIVKSCITARTAEKSTDPLAAEVETPPSGEEKPKKTTPKKKVLRISKNGKLLSSPPPTKPDAASSASPKRRRGRPRTKAVPLPTVTVIRYGSDIESRRVIGNKIQDIMAGNQKSVPKPSPPKEPAKPAGPPKPTHPFFSGKPMKNKQEPAPSKIPAETRVPQSPNIPKKSAVTPGKLRAEARPPTAQQSFPAFGPIAGDSRILKYPGMTEPPWPTKTTAHVRNIDGIGPTESSTILGSGTPVHRERKLKNNVIDLTQHEDLIGRFSQQLKGIDETPDHVRLPARLLTTGIDICKRVQRELRAPLADYDEEQPSSDGIHPALLSFYKDIEATLTAFDRGACETQSWVQKYAPSCAAQVLQPGKEATVLRDWLKNLTVMSVEGGKDKSGTGNTSESKKPQKKRRKRAEDDFIVSDEEEDEEDMVEVSDCEEFGRPVWNHHRLRSLRRARMTRNKNVVILSGPHGCGKSATVYAVAKELGFEVFEVNSSTRRSGKDVQDKVGDMTANHLVSHNRSVLTPNADPIAADDTDNERMSVALQKDLDSGRQGTMMSFFKSNTQAKAKPKPKPTAKPTTEPKKVSNAAQATLFKGQVPPKDHKQSLILFEEADVLFEEDQQFWAQVIRLASHSKRPIVITCNDETLVPSFDLPLGAILRLSPPPVDLAADYLLLVAAKEGHILKRGAVCDLFKSKVYDLRASITELDFWCQMSVGDKKGGLEWIYQRWPPGKDIDEHGRVLRVASEGTYQSGMGWLCHDVVPSTANLVFDKEEEFLKASWMDWGISPSQWTETLVPTVNDVSVSESSLQSLKRLESMSDAVSAADVYCRIGLPSYERQCDELVDPSLPPMTDRDRLNYTEAAPVIQIEHVSDFTSFDTAMFVQTHLSIQRAFASVLPSDTQGKASSIPKTEEDFATAIVDHKAATHNNQPLTRTNFSYAFDILASPPATTLPLSATYQLTASSFDRTFALIVLDLAPYVRSIVAHELRLEGERLRVGSLLTEGGRSSKRARTTRASRVAMEGGRRETKRRERWFGKELNRVLVMSTAGKSWAGLGSVREDDEGEGSTRTFGETGSLASTQEE
ncbi:hypothetical protein BCR34DRAFT_595549 [Clohesyomyces aquaticus]|uniref:AAA+ ATPase domain-containing protein n=1 Tax=Clohesyomyces aquaticus TaxID=1231657 RepID=A0A1Y2AAR9_9PLEO|nr:hypothetical protein BCR34DRAFT_595549 [Clohesyomyces aquaticus]